ncbi:MAG: family 16 glycosylhydrolase [Endomicrobia bacterium]|nr:family 16 glycosylhydrolase [Endomicrobiia bacterium]
MKKLIFVFLFTHYLFSDFIENFLSFDNWDINVGSTTLTYKITFDTSCLDSYCLELNLPLGYNLSGPNKGINVVSRNKYSYGKYKVRMRSAYGGENAGVVSAFFTYFNDYWQYPTNFTDTNKNGISDNSEIDIEFLSKEPSTIYMTVWTDYDEVGGSSRFRKVTRKINLSTGEIFQTPFGKEHTYELIKLSQTFQPVFSNFNHTQNFYEYSFEWSSTTIKFYITIFNLEVLLWEVSGENLIPKNEAYIMANIWHNNIHWDNGAAALAPSINCSMKVDKIEFLSIEKSKKDNYVYDKKNYILYLNEKENSSVNFGKIREVKIFDIKGNLVRTIIDPLGIYNLYDKTKYSEKVWDGRNKDGKYVTTGVYLYQAEDENVITGSVLVIK